MDQVARLDTGIKDGSLAVEIDKIHGLDPVIHHGKKDVHISLINCDLTETHLGENLEIPGIPRTSSPRQQGIKKNR
jgi:hypothetical protein